MCAHHQLEILELTTRRTASRLRCGIRLVIGRIHLEIEKIRPVTAVPSQRTGVRSEGSGRKSPHERATVGRKLALKMGAKWKLPRKQQGNRIGRGHI